jgi:hypothetical protein
MNTRNKHHKRRDIEGTRPGPTLETKHRVTMAWSLRRQGLKWREIAERLGWCSGSQAYTSCHRYEELMS